MPDDSRTKLRIDHIERILGDIEATVPRLVSMEERLRAAQERPATVLSRDYWARQILQFASRRLVVLIGTTFQRTETLGILAGTRYVFEMALWIRNVAAERDYALVYYRQQLATMKQYFVATLHHLEKEAAFLKRIDEKETALQGAALVQALEQHQRDPGAGLNFHPHQLMATIDDEAARTFSMFFDDAVTNGYGFQAYLLKTQAIPGAQEQITACTAALATFDAGTDEQVQSLAKKKWVWKDAAARVGMLEEYEFIYGYTSKLLHATPASITTVHQELEPIEVRTFLRYLLVTIRGLCEEMAGAAFQDLFVPSGK